MVKYNIGNVDPDSLYLGTYYVRTKTPSKGKNAGIPKTDVFQVRRKSGSDEQYWSKVSPSKVVAGRPPALSARLLSLTPSDEALRAYREGNKVYLHTAFDHEGEHPTSHFILRRRSDGDQHVYYWSTLKEGGDKKVAAKRSPKKNLKKPGRKPKAK